MQYNFIIRRKNRWTNKEDVEERLVRDISKEEAAALLYVLDHYEWPSEDRITSIDVKVSYDKDVSLSLEQALYHFSHNTCDLDEFAWIINEKITRPRNYNKYSKMCITKKLN